MTHRVGLKGQVVIPKPMRDALGLQAGDEVDFELDDGAVRVEPARPRQSLRGLLAGHTLTDILETDHRAELG